MSESDTVDLITSINLSDKQAIELVRFLKRTISRGIFTSSLKKALATRKTIFKDLIDKEEVNFVDSDGKSSKQTLVFCNDIEAMVDVVTAARGIENEKAKHLVSVDGGKGRKVLSLIINDDSKPAAHKMKLTGAK